MPRHKLDVSKFRRSLGVRAYTGWGEGERAFFCPLSLWERAGVRAVWSAIALTRLVQSIWLSQGERGLMRLSQGREGIKKRQFVAWRSVYSQTASKVGDTTRQITPIGITARFGTSATNDKKNRRSSNAVPIGKMCLLMMESGLPGRENDARQRERSSCFPFGSLDNQYCRSIDSVDSMGCPCRFGACAEYPAGATGSREAFCCCRRCRAARRFC